MRSKKCIYLNWFHHYRSLTHFHMENIVYWNSATMNRDVLFLFYFSSERIFYLSCFSVVVFVWAPNAFFPHFFHIRFFYAFVGKISARSFNGRAWLTIDKWRWSLVLYTFNVYRDTNIHFFALFWCTEMHTFVNENRFIQFKLCKLL